MFECAPCMHEVRRLKQSLANRELRTLRKSAGGKGLAMNDAIKEPLSAEPMSVTLIRTTSTGCLH